MTKIAVSILALGTVFAVPAFANEAVHNDQRVTSAAIVSVENAGPAAIDGTLSFAPPLRAAPRSTRPARLSAASNQRQVTEEKRLRNDLPGRFP